MLAFLTLNVAEATAPEIPPREYPEGLEEYKYYAYDLVVDAWGESQWGYFDDLIYRESSWRSTAQNPSSTAFGLAQFLDSTWALVDCEKTTEPDEQIRCGVEYVKEVYGTPRKAIIHHNENNWY